MITEKTLAAYMGMTNGQELIDAGVVPKTSSEHLSLITQKRLEKLIEQTFASINDQMFGTWYDAISFSKLKISELTSAEDIKRYAKVGMRVKGRERFDKEDLTNMQGKIAKIYAEDSKFAAGICFDEPLRNGHDLDGILKGEDANKGYNVNFGILRLVPEPEDDITVEIKGSYKLSASVVADAKLGHKVRFKGGFSGEARKSGGGNRSKKVNLPESLAGNLKEYNARDNTVTIAFESKINDDLGNELVFDLEYCKNSLQASSLGQLIPGEKQKEVRKKVLDDFFPTTVLDNYTSEKVIISMLLGKSMVFFGPPGSGKSNLANDIIKLAKLQEVIFKVDGCQAQCNPYSLFNYDFYKAVQPCPECMANYDPKFKTTGRFNLVKPEDVKVVVAKFTRGFGIEETEGTVGLNRSHMAGFKIPRLDGTTTEGRESAFDPEGFQAGILVRGNNGYLKMEEIDKLRPPSLDNLLFALQEKIIAPDQLRFYYPANCVIIATGNDPTKLSGPINDRVVVITVPYPTDVDVSYNVTRKAYHKEVAELKDAPIGDTHKLRKDGVRCISMPLTLEKAIDAFYLKFRSEYNGGGKTEVSGSNRSKIDALDSARAYLLVDRMFFSDLPEIATESYAMKGISYAIDSRFLEPNLENDKKYLAELNTWIADNFPKLHKQEQDKFWCEVYREMAIRKIQVEEIHANFVAEIIQYDADISSSKETYNLLKKAYDAPDNAKFQKARLKYPFMDYLFENQPGFSKIKTEQISEMMDYFMKSRENTSCELSGLAKKESKSGR
jgi:MoxR-like ATPase